MLAETLLKLYTGCYSCRSLIEWKLYGRIFRALKSLTIGSCVV